MDIISNIIGHFYNFIFIIGFILRNILWLRIAMIFGALIELIYFIIPGNQDWGNVIWSLIWIIVNTIQIILLIRTKSDLKLSDDEYRIYKLVFTPLNQRNFKKLITKARWESVKAGTILVQEGVHLSKLILIFSGVAEVKIEGQLVAYLRDGNFIGEMSFITGNKTSAKVTALSEIKFLTWDKEDLNNIISESKELEEQLNDVINFDLVKKLVQGKD
jgi:hypothetical protein